MSQLLCGSNVVKASAFRCCPSTTGLEYVRKLLVLRVVLIYIRIGILSYYVYKPMQFYIIATLVGLVMGGIQTLSRSTYSAYLPETKDTTSFFSFYDVTEKLGIVIGMGVYGMIDQFTNNMRNATISLIVFFVLGMLLLFKVRKVSRVANE